ncbi:MAG: DNA-directed RNA polymerase subunit E'' [Candidatus Aenigmarchaeota archaeon]|nr:DNA-directed RNA polymerase subunit E'' [Candidatus Aenigmarchaeota archaeon]
MKKEKREKVCRNCRLFVDGDECPICGESNFSNSWKGTALINDPNGSEIAKFLDIKAKGKYALWVK